MPSLMGARWVGQNSSDDDGGDNSIDGDDDKWLDNL